MLRRLHRACLGTHLRSRTGSDHGQSPRPQAQEGEGVDRGAGLRVSLLTRLLAGVQPDRRSFQQDQGYAAPSGSPYEGRFGGGIGRSAFGGQRPRRSRLLRACRLPLTIPTTVKRAVGNRTLAALMLESKVRLAPQLRGASKHTLWPLRDQP